MENVYTIRIYKTMKKQKIRKREGVFCQPVRPQDLLLKTPNRLTGVMRGLLEEFRLPLCEMSDANKDKLKKVLKGYGLI